MRLFTYMKDGGKHSRVWGWFLVELKSLFSVVVLKFEDGSREAYHTHAFWAISWLFRGKLREDLMDGTRVIYRPSFLPILTPRDRFHRVSSVGTSYAITFRGPWLPRWREYLVGEQRYVDLTHGRREIPEDNLCHVPRL